MAGATITNEGNKVVTGNTVATAIQESGWNIGLADSSKANKAFDDGSKALSADKLEKVNPDDNVRFADGKNTKVQAATVDEVNRDGKKITNTYVRFNVDLPIVKLPLKIRMVIRLLKLPMVNGTQLKRVNLIQPKKP